MAASLNMPPRRTRSDFKASQQISDGEVRFYLSLIFAIASLPYLVVGAFAAWLLGV